jgi:hypothetical protein
MSDSRTMIAGCDVPIKMGEYDNKVTFERMVGRKPKASEIITYEGEQYAKLPDGWPAAEDKDLEEAHAEAVLAEGEPQDIYATFTPDEVRELCEDWVRLLQENTALRKGMKTMQRKQRKQTQVQRRLERRLNQARAGREQLRADAAKATQRKIDDAARALLEVIDSREVK